MDSSASKPQTMSANLVLQNFSQLDESIKEIAISSFGIELIFGIFPKNSLNSGEWFKDEVFTYLWFLTIPEEQKELSVNYKVSILGSDDKKLYTQCKLKILVYYF